MEKKTKMFSLLLEHFPYISRHNNVEGGGENMLCVGKRNSIVSYRLKKKIKFALVTAVHSRAV